MMTCHHHLQGQWGPGCLGLALLGANMDRAGLGPKKLEGVSRGSPCMGTTQGQEAWAGATDELRRDSTHTVCWHRPGGQEALQGHSARAQCGDRCVLGLLGCLQSPSWG